MTVSDEWITFSTDAGSCVEFTREGDYALVRNSNESEGPVLRFTQREWEVFIHGIRAGGGDLWE